MGVAIRHVQKFLNGKRILYATPTADQLSRWWAVVTNALAEPIRAGVYYKNETEHIIELKGTEQRLRGKTAWNSDTLRGDYCDDLTLDEWQLCDEDAWELVGAPMMLDTNGDAMFIYTPPSLRSRSVSKARDPQHAAKMYKKFKERQEAGDTRYATFNFTSHDNPHLSREALDEITGDMTPIAYRMEIMAEDVEEAPGALWKRDTIEKYRVQGAPELVRIVISIDPAVSTSATSDETGIIAEGIDRAKHCYTLADASGIYTSLQWASKAIALYENLEADCIVAEVNNGGDLVEANVRAAGFKGRVVKVHSSRGKATRAEPVSAYYDQGKCHHVGSFPGLEDQMVLWEPGAGDSPDRCDALTFAVTHLITSGGGWARRVE